MVLSWRIWWGWGGSGWASLGPLALLRVRSRPGTLGLGGELGQDEGLEAGKAWAMLEASWSPGERRVVAGSPQARVTAGVGGGGYTLGVQSGMGWVCFPADLLHLR